MDPSLSIEDFRNSLPITEHKQKIIEIVKNSLFCVITGDTGSGKSTQLPQYILDSQEILDVLKENQMKYDLSNNQKSKLNHLHEDNKVSVVITQPRRVAAIQMAKRICYERNVSLGDDVGYTIRFDDKTSSKTHLKYMTDGILVRECLQDDTLSKYNVVILDEAHERSLYTDVLFALIKQAVKKRQGSLKLIVTSATLNTDQFSKFFDNCPIFSMKGKLFNVEVRYKPILMNLRIEESINIIMKIHQNEGPGDILVFLTGSEECEIAKNECLERLQKDLEKGIELAGMMIFSLYGSLGSEDQQQIFMKTPENCRKVVFSTNIAETSLTIDNIGFVIDCGYVKQKCYNPRTGMDALIVVPISQVQAVQRTGRAGRTQEGLCFRLYSKKFYDEDMKPHTVPEIKRVSLNSVVLTLKSMGIHDVINFDYMEHPDREQLLQALKQLYFLQAIEQDGKITDLGKEMNKFPLEPSYAKSLLTSYMLRCEDEMVTLVALLSSEQIWSKPSRVRAQEFERFEECLKRFADPDGDHFSLLNIYYSWKRNKCSDGYAKSNFFNIRALKQGENIKIQINDLIKNIDKDVLKKFYKEDAMYLYYKENREKKDSDSKSKSSSQKKEDKYNEKFDQKNQKQQNPVLTQSDIFRLALASGFYYNSARKVQNSTDSYLLIYPEGNVVDIDPQSVYSISQNYPPHVIFTELGGNNQVRGVMRYVSQIDPFWVSPYVSMIKNVNAKRLAGLDQNQTKQEIVQKKKTDEELQKEKQDRILEIQEKKKQALARLNERKKLQKN
ncbi:hypothetical protein ABPG72_011333 [Tetrahymena utriculariae]